MEKQAVIPREAMPGIATLANVTDPASLRAVDPQMIAQVFGSDVHLRSIKIEPTRAPIERKLHTKPPWLARMSANRFLGNLDGTRQPRFYAFNLVGAD
jgi:hypothetical protein